MTMKATARRLARLELQRQPVTPGRVVVVFPGDPEPQDLGPNDHVVRVVFGDVAEPAGGDT